MITVHLVNVDQNGEVDYNHLEELLTNLKDEKVLVSLMHANNEIGTICDLKHISTLCRVHGAYLHSDTVQTVAHLPFDLEELDIDFLSASAHKFHGPKGVGFIYINGDINVHPMIDGGGQERNMRGGTENVYGIVGLAKALELSYAHLEEHRAHIDGLRSYFKSRLEQDIPNILFNGHQEDGKYLFTVLNISFPPCPKSELLNFSLDMAGIAASGGSACSSGTESRSYVIENIGSPASHKAIRFSFSHLNTKEEIDYVVEKLVEMLGTVVPA